MVLSFEFETRFELMVKQAKESVCAEIDIKAQSLRELFTEEVKRQREELLDTMTTLGLTTDESKPEQVLIRGEQADNSPNDANSTKAGVNNRNDQQQREIPMGEATNANNQATDDSLVDSEMINSNSKRQLRSAKSQQANTVAPIKVEDEEEEVELDNLDDNDCDCPDCQSSNGTSNQNVVGELIQQPDNSNEEAPVPRKKRKLSGNQSLPQSGSSSSRPQQLSVGAENSSPNPAINLPQINDVNVNGRYTCTHPGCGQIYRWNSELHRHRRTHHPQRPYRCLWESCTFSSNRYNPMKRHIRKAHFKLPQTLKEIAELGLTEPGDPEQWIETIEEFL